MKRAIVEWRKSQTDDQGKRWKRDLNSDSDNIRRNTVRESYTDD